MLAESFRTFESRLAVNSHIVARARFDRLQICLKSVILLKMLKHSMHICLGALLSLVTYFDTRNVNEFYDEPCGSTVSGLDTNLNIH